jgi:hypothetical protein
MNHRRKKGGRAVTAEKPADRRLVSSMPQSQSRLLMRCGVEWISPSGKSNGPTDLLFLSCPAMENQCAPREFNFMSCSVKPVPFASISATTFAASSPNSGSNFCILSLTKVRTNHLRPSLSRTRVFSLKQVLSLVHK